jgi:hypothetical protein
MQFWVVLAVAMEGPDGKEEEQGESSEKSEGQTA